MTVLSFFAAASFDPETTASLALAFDTAWERVKRSGSPLADKDAAATRELLAKQIIAAARDGERTPNRLVERALSQLAGHLKAQSSGGTGGSSG